MGIVLLLLLQPAPPPLEAKLEHVQKIWDQDPHSAFTDLVRWQDRFVGYLPGQGSRTKTLAGTLKPI